MALYESRKLNQHREALDAARRGDGQAGRPLHVRLEPTEACNFQCRFCWTQSPERMALLTGAGGFAHRRAPGMTAGRLERLLDELAECGTRAVSFVAIGDPLVFPGIDAVIERAHRLGLAVSATSNLGMKLGDRLVDRLARAAWIRWSMNGGTRDGYLHINRPRGNAGQSAYERVQDNVRRILERRRDLGSAMTLNASVVMCDWNRGELYAAARLAHGLGIDGISFRPDMDLRRGGEPVAIPESDREDLARAIRDFSGPAFRVHVEDQRADEVTAVTDDSLRCFYSNYSIFIASGGDVYPCCYTRGFPSYVMGNVAEQDFRTFWRSAERGDAWRNLAVKDCPSCPYVGLNEGLRGLRRDTVRVEEIHVPRDPPDPFV